MTTPSGPVDPYTGEPAIEVQPAATEPVSGPRPASEDTVARLEAGQSPLPRAEAERVERVRQETRFRAVRSSDVGIWVPAGFAVLAFAMLLALVLLPVSGTALLLVIVVLIIAVVLMIGSGLDMMKAARRRRQAGQDTPHAIGLE